MDVRNKKRTIVQWKPKSPIMYYYINNGDFAIIWRMLLPMAFLHALVIVGIASGAIWHARTYMWGQYIARRFMLKIA